jgi:hypothetical protein
MATPEIRIPLFDPIKGHNSSTIHEIVLREPKYGDVIQLGDPRAYGHNDGVQISREIDEIVEAYINRLVVEPKDTGLLNQLSLADTIVLKQTVHGFFGKAYERISTRGPTVSSST